MNSTTHDAPQDRFCDLVMKGGITSGVVYPKAITALSKHYRFKSIGGTSAGAIAAAVTAAAEFNRRSNKSRNGFDLLDKLPEQLQASVPGSGGSKLLSLFQPQPETRRLFQVLVWSLNKKGAYGRVVWIVAGLLAAYWPATLAGAVVSLLVGFFGPGWFTAVLLFAVLLIATVGAWVYLDVTRKVTGNGFGLCTGMTREGTEALTPWLHKLIQEAAGLNEKAGPLTFGMLWNAPGFPPEWMNPKPQGTYRSIDLQVFSTNLAHGRPYIFPLCTPAKHGVHLRYQERLFFNPAELGQYLPDELNTWMREKGKPYKVEPGRSGIDPDESEALDRDLLEIPQPEDFPVLLAARMSLSFPLLLSAIPLWAINEEAPKGKRFQRCWFSDGGISSNFPMHLFDGFVPRWPTFGISLEPAIDGQDGAQTMVTLPEAYSEGCGERWNCFASKDSPASQFGGFLSAIVGAMQNWNDNSLARMPGVRDRIARVKLEANLGGLNLNMEEKEIQTVASRGEAAAVRLISRFVAQATAAQQAKGWDQQRFVRMGVLLKMIQARAEGIQSALGNCGPHATALKTIIDEAAKPAPANGGPPAGYEAPLTQQEAEALKAMLDAILQLAIASQAAPCNFTPIPEPELRVRPPL
ncbi:MAG: patatin-like phospholipase family protein [Rhodocyclaceae bacterium]